MGRKAPGTNGPESTRCKIGVLYLVGTPIGNLADITFRAVETLKSVAVIAAEDTRQSRKLCQRYEISAPLVPLHEHNEASQSARLIERLLNGESAAYVTDAGMPVISDPGARLVRAAREAGVPVAVVPGPSAVPAALALSGFRGERFRFEGFPPKKSAAMVRWLEGLREEGAPVICFESPYRLVKTLTLIRETLGEIPVFVARELTKLHEEGVAGSTGELIRRYTERPPKGEVTLLFQPQP
ncbi:MAG: 16S rRNA (cytidine(1402)-2'-O)-methyltransferase [Candidatus Omnitrophica bacterium CG11_big_fil_rev_8_21_14_0_20_64_10]|nr:MAG: 16S rRNA (cytidine(1402)-2'-O)-methyltransferase [Candidatus Omnitrophica bacterium CG11_big_fil_rev_8_21_14_0_20_64_10]